MEHSKHEDLPQRLAALLEERTTMRQDGAPLLIGVGGGTASGKTTLAHALAARLQPLRVEIVGQDRFFRQVAELPPFPSPTRTRPWPDYNRPDSFNVDAMLAHCRSLRGMPVAILEGILVLHYPEARALMDLRLYVEADADERIVRRIRRNVKAGMDLDDVSDYYLESVRLQHQRFNAPTRRYADLVVPGGSGHDGLRAKLLDDLGEAIAAHVCRAGNLT